MTAHLAGLGQWLPEKIRENSEWPPEFVARGARSERRELVDVNLAATDAEDPAEAISRRYFAAEAGDPFLGSRRRRVAEPAMTAPQAETLAAERALADAGVAPDQIDVIISWAAVPERIVPASAAQVAALLHAENASTFGLDAACASPLAQLEVAAALIDSGRARRVLLTQSHLITRAFADMHPASPNIGDAATAMVVCAGEGPRLLASHARTHGEYYDSVTWCRGKDTDPPWWEAGPAYYLGSHDPAGAQFLIQSTVRIAATTVRELLAKAQLRPEQVGVLASVQPRRWIPQAIVEALGAPIFAPQTFDDFAHLGGCGVITNLIRARESGALTPGTHVVLYAQGAGFLRGATLLRW